MVCKINYSYFYCNINKQTIVINLLVILPYKFIFLCMNHNFRLFAIVYKQKSLNVLS